MSLLHPRCDLGLKDTFFHWKITNLWNRIEIIHNLLQLLTFLGFGSGGSVCQNCFKPGT